MTGGPRLRTVVADTSALVSLGVARAVNSYDTDVSRDPSQYLLTSCDVSVPPPVVSGLEETAQYEDVHGAAAKDVLAARGHYVTEDPYEMATTPDTRPALGLDDGETDCITLANALGVDGLLTDAFGGTNFALIRAALRGPRIVPAPRLICEYARNGHTAFEEARTLVSVLGTHRSWDESSYPTRLPDQLE